MALILNNYGWFSVDVKQYDKAQKLYNRALTLRQKALLSSFAHYESEYNRVFSNFGQLRDTFASQNNYTKAVEIQTKCVQSIEILRGVLENGDTRAAQEYGSLSWFALFEIEFTVAKNAARRGLELDATQTWIKANLAHALLFQNNNAEAKIVYDALKIQKSTQGNSFRNALNADFDALEQAGLDKKQLDKARKWVAAE